MERKDPPSPFNDDFLYYLEDDEFEAKEAPRAGAGNQPSKWPLTEWEYERYGRQLILPGFGVDGQLRLRAAKVLVIGAGGLGCPAAAYLAGAGVGCLGVVDGDFVEVSNLHRQIGHATPRVGVFKAESLVEYLRALNPLPNYEVYQCYLDPRIATEIMSRYDVVLDCTDNPATRYLISDSCVLLQKPLVSASALRTDGQLMVLNCPPAPQGAVTGGPCYRCIFPRPPPAETILSCGEGGVFGPAVGTMGVLQAGEAIKMIVRGECHFQTDQGDQQPPPQPSMLLFSSPLSGTPSFRTVRMRGRRADCAACSATATLSLRSLADGSTADYVRFCGGPPGPNSTLSPEERVTAREYATVLRRVTKDHLLLDVREREHFAIASIDGAVNVPFSQIASRQPIRPEDAEQLTRPEWLPPALPDTAPIYVVCRVGNDSQVVTRRLKEWGLDRGGGRFIGDISGGMRAWKREVDPTLPFI